MDNPFALQSEQESINFNSSSSEFDSHKAAFDTVSTIRFIYGIIRQFLAYFKVFGGNAAIIARLAGTGAEFLLGAVFTLVKPNTSIKDKIIAILKVFAITVGFAIGGFLTLFLGPLAPFIAGGIFAASTLIELGLCAYDFHQTRKELKTEKANLNDLKTLLKQKTESEKTEQKTSAAAQLTAASNIKNDQKPIGLHLTLDQINQKISESERKIADLTTKRHQQGLAIIGCVLSTIAATIAFAAIFVFPPIGIVLTAVALGVGVLATGCFVAKKVWELVTNIKNKKTDESSEQAKSFFHRAKRLLSRVFNRKNSIEEQESLIKTADTEADKPVKNSVKHILNTLNDHDPSPGTTPVKSPPMPWENGMSSASDDQQIVNPKDYSVLLPMSSQSAETEEQKQHGSCRTQAREEGAQGIFTSANDGQDTSELVV